MSASNVMEVITVGRYENEDQQGAVRSSSAQSTRTESQLSLEYLPPEAPHYGQAATTVSLDAADPMRCEQDSERDDLVERIKQLSEQVRSNLRSVATDVQRPPLQQHNTTEAGCYELSTASGGGGGGEEGSSGLEIEDEEDDEGTMMELEASGATSPDSLRDSVSSSTTAAAGASGFFPVPANPKLQSAIEKMKKLDKKLADLTKKEQEVKRQRRLLEQMEAATSTEIVPLVEDIDGGDGHTPTTSPVFATQVDDNASSAGESCREAGSVVEGSSSSSSTRGSGRGQGAMEEEEEGEGSMLKGGHRQKESKGQTNFIRRNIELASDAGALIAMTDTERNRLEELLNDDSPETEGPYATPLCLPAASSVEGDGGFSLNERDSSRMRDIDSRLLALMPADGVEWEAVRSSSSPSSNSVTPAPSSVTDDDRTTVTATDLEAEVELPDMTGTAKQSIGPGEGVLQQFQMSREASQRLRDIDEQLRRLQEDKELEQHFVPSLPEGELERLLEQCISKQHSGTGDGGHTSEQQQQHLLLADIQANES